MATLHRKHFRAFASILAEQAQPYMERPEYVALVRRVSGELAKTNDEYRPSTFREACGLEPGE